MRAFGYFLRAFHLLTEIYPLVPFPPSVREGFSDYTRTSLRRGPVTRALACAQERPEATLVAGYTLILMDIEKDVI